MNKTTTTTTPGIDHDRTDYERLVAKTYGLKATTNRVAWSVGRDVFGYRRPSTTPELLATIDADVEGEVSPEKLAICLAHLLCLADEAEGRRKHTEQARALSLASMITGVTFR